MPVTSARAAVCATRKALPTRIGGPSWRACVKNTATLVDTGFLVALFNDGDFRHADARAMLASLAGARLYTVWEVLPLYLLTLFAKGDKANLTKAERNELTRLVGVLMTSTLLKQR